MHIILAYLASVKRALSLSCLNVLVDALLTEHVIAGTKDHRLFPGVTDGTLQLLTILLHNELQNADISFLGSTMILLLALLINRGCRALVERLDSLLQLLNFILAL